MRTLNENGIAILKEREGFYKKPYKCPAGIWTIGIGTTHYPDGRPVTKNDPEINISQAIVYMGHELEDKAATIENWINKNKLLLTGNQFSSLLCFAYNLGCGPITDRERSLNQALLHKSDKEIRAAFMMYTKAKVKNCLGISTMKTLSGLVIRRKLEADLFFKPEV